VKARGGDGKIGEKPGGPKGVMRHKGENDTGVFRMREERSPLTTLSSPERKKWGDRGKEKKTKTKEISTKKRGKERDGADPVFKKKGGSETGSSKEGEGIPSGERSKKGPLEGVPLGTKGH